MLEELNSKKPTSILISNHGLNHITGVCTRILLMEKGKIIKGLKTSSDTLTELEDYFRAMVRVLRTTALLCIFTKTL